MSNPNELYTYRENFYVILDARNATTYLNGSYNSSILFNFEDPIKKPPNSLTLAVSVLNFVCPNSIYI